MAFRTPRVTTARRSALTAPAHSSTSARQIQDDFTITAWINSSNNSRGGSDFYGGDGLIYADVPGLTNDFGTAILNNRFAFGTGGANDITIQSTSTVTTGDWVYVAAVRAGSIISVYVNGASRGIGRYSIYRPAEYAVGDHVRRQHRGRPVLHRAHRRCGHLRSCPDVDGYPAGVSGRRRRRIALPREPAGGGARAVVRRGGRRQRQYGRRNGVDHRQLPGRRGYARLHRSERHHRQLQRGQRRADLERVGDPGAVPGRVAVGDLFQFERRSVRLDADGQLIRSTTARR